VADIVAADDTDDIVRLLLAAMARARLAR